MKGLHRKYDTLHFHKQASMQAMVWPDVQNTLFFTMRFSFYLVLITKEITVDPVQFISARSFCPL